MDTLVIFDCFGVIFDEIAPQFFLNHFEEKKALELKEHYFVKADLGYMTNEEVFIQMEKDFGLDSEMLRKEFYSLIHLRENVVAKIAELHDRADIALLSNAAKGFVEGLFEKYDLNKYFKKVIVSSNVHLAKPDKEIYKYCLSELNGNYSKIYFVDDNLCNTIGLEDLGIEGIHFTDVSSLDKIK